MIRYLIVFCCFRSLAVVGQTDTVFVKRTDLVRGLDAVGYTFTAPARWKAKDWGTLGGVVALTAAVTFADEPIRDFWKGKQNGFLDHFEWVGNKYGKPYTAVGITGGFYLVGVIFKNDWAKETGLMLASAHATSTVIQTFLKNAVGRARPNLGIGNYEADPFASGSPNHSFPSGHTTVAFTTSLVLAHQVKQVPLKIVFYSLATLTAASRMYLDVHWMSDVTFGSAIGWFCADAAMKRIQSNRFRPMIRERAIKLKLYPYPGGITVRAQL